MKNSVRRLIEVGACAASVFILAACGALIGTRDLTEDDGAGDSGPNGGIDANGHDAFVPPTEGGVDASAPVDGAIDDAADTSVSCSGADLQNDKHQCGRCGHDCLGGDCKAGVCQAFVLVPNQSGVDGIAVDDSGLYWTSFDQGQVLHAAKDGTGLVVLSNEVGSEPFNLAVDATDVYWTVTNTATDSPPGGVSRCSKTTGCLGGATHLTPALREAYGIAIDDTHVYWSEYDNGAVGRVSKTGTGFGYLVTQQSFSYGIALRDGDLYFTSSNEVGAVAANGSVVATNKTAATAPFRTLVPATGFADYEPHGIAIDANNVFWTNRTIIAPTINDVAKNSTGQAPNSILASTEPMPTNIAVDDTNAYWVAQGKNTATASDPGAIYVNGVAAMCPKTGCPGGKAIVLASDLHNPFAIAIDATAIYFSVRGQVVGEGAIMKIAK